MSDQVSGRNFLFGGSVIGGIGNGERGAAAGSAETFARRASKKEQDYSRSLSFRPSIMQSIWAKGCFVCGSYAITP